MLPVVEATERASVVDPRFDLLLMPEFFMLIPMLLRPKIASTLSAQSAAFSHISLDKRLRLSARTVAIMRPLLRTQRRGGLILFWVCELLPEPPIWRMTRACSSGATPNIACSWSWRAIPTAPH